jgi:hypothetical protein
VAALGCVSGPATAVEVLVNGSFEAPVAPNANANNLNLQPTGWSKTSGTWNLLRITSATYPAGPLPHDGSQYLDIGGDSTVFRDFTISGTAGPPGSRSKVTFDAWFSNRLSGSFVSSVGIYDQTGTTLLSSLATVDRTGDGTPTADWEQGQGELLLEPGTYQVRIALGNGNNVDDVSVDEQAPDEVCRLLRLTSNGTVSPDPGGTLFGTGGFTAFCGGTDCVIEMKQEGVFSNGLVLNDGQFPADCNGPNAECFPNQNPDPFPTTQGAFGWGDFNLDGLDLTSGVGGTISFDPGGAYTYTGAKFSGHSGTYEVVACTDVVPVPVPGTAALMLLPLAGLAALRRRRRSLRG